MRRILASLQGVESTRLLACAGVLGVSLGVFIHGYWLIDVFPVDSRRLLYSTLLGSLLGMGGYFLLLRWIRNRLQGLPTFQQLRHVGSGILIGAFLFFTATDRWQEPSRYATLFLPPHTLQVSISPDQASGDVSILWINTSLGGISFDDVDFDGWKRETDRLVLTDFSKNSLNWEGKTGEEAQIVFQASAQNGNAVISWDGQEEGLPLAGKKYTYTRLFDVPFLASRGWILLLGAINFAVLCFPLYLLVWEKRLEMRQSLSHALSEISYRLTATDGLILLIGVALALALRTPNLGNIFPSVDEYYQLNAAKQIAQGAPLESVYQRSLWLVTIPSSLAFRVFGFEIWAARWVGAIFNALAIIPLYLIARRMNRVIAVLSVALFATNPLVITFGRHVREYAYYPFFYFWIILAMILFLERFPDRFRIYQDWKILFKPSLLLLGLLLALPPVYALEIDTSSTFKLILLAYLVFAVFIFFRMDLGDRKNLFIILFVVTGALAGGFIWLQRFSLTLAFNTLPIQYFFPNSPQQWYFDRLVLIPALGLLGAVSASFLLRRVNFIPVFLLSLYAAFLSFFVFSSNTFISTRHLSTTQLWFVLFMAFGLYVVWIFLQTFTFSKNRTIQYMMAFALGASFLNIRQSLLPMTSSDPYMPISKDYHYELEEVHTYMLENVRDGDVLIHTVYDLYVIWKGEPEFQATHRFKSDMPKEEALALVNQYDSGWIVIDKIILKLIPYQPFEVFSEKNGIEYVGLFGDQYVWRWQAHQP